MPGLHVCRDRLLVAQHLKWPPVFILIILQYQIWHSSNVTNFFLWRWTFEIRGDKLNRIIIINLFLLMMLFHSCFLSAPHSWFCLFVKCLSGNNEAAFPFSWTSPCSKDIWIKKNNVNGNSVLVLSHVLGQEFTHHNIGIFSIGHCVTKTNFHSFPFCASKTLAQIPNFYINSRTYVKTVLKVNDIM